MQSIDTIVYSRRTSEIQSDIIAMQILFSAI